METFEPAFDYVSPEVSANTRLGQLALNHYNTRIRLFEAPNEHFNHIEHTYEDEEGRTKIVGLNASSEQIQRFIDMAFPRLILPFVDQDTLEWAVRNGLRHMNEQLGVVDNPETPDGTDAA